MDPESTLAKVYEMLYPYGEFNGDIALSCVAIHRELKTLCREEMRFPLLIVGKFLDLNFTHDTPTTKIYDDIDKLIMDKCLSFDSNTSAKVVIGYKTGIIDPSNVELRDWDVITFVTGMSNFIVDDISRSIISNKRDYDNWYRTRNNTRENYYEAYADNYDPDGAYTQKKLERHVRLIEKVLKLIYEGKIPIIASYEEIRQYLANN
jgi:hypothetical protein